MIRCAICKSRVRPPERAWAETGDRRVVNFYRTGTPMEVYHKELTRLAKSGTIFVHEDCWEAEGKPSGMLVALSLENRLQWRRQLQTQQSNVDSGSASTKHGAAGTGQAS